MLKERRLTLSFVFNKVLAFSNQPFVVKDYYFLLFFNKLPAA
jgi:hypothetical protein